MRLSGCPEFGQGRDPIFYVTRTVFLTRLGSPEGGRPIVPGPWPENRALPVRAAGLVPDALAKAQAPSGVLSVPGARSEWLSDFDTIASASVCVRRGSTKNVRFEPATVPATRLRVLSLRPRAPQLRQHVQQRFRT